MLNRCDGFVAMIRRDSITTNRRTDYGDHGITDIYRYIEVSPIPAKPLYAYSCISTVRPLNAYTVYTGPVQNRDVSDILGQRS
mgnify:FL=1